VPEKMVKQNTQNNYINQSLLRKEKSNHVILTCNLKRLWGSI